MTAQSQRPRAARVWDDPRIRFPDEETWSRLSPAEREATLERIEAVLDEYREAMSEGTRHVKRKMGIAADLDAFFRRQGRDVYIGSELAVLYPAENAIVPGVLAVLDCDPDYEPERWVVQDEKRGIDLVIEVRNRGKKHKDVVENVLDYARLRIPEYFSFDCRRGVLRGWRLADPQSRTYQPIVPQGGSLRSNVLGLELAVLQMRLRFFQGQSMVPTETELISRLQTIIDERQGALDLAERQRADAIDQLSRVQVALARSILDVCRLRGLALSDEQRARIAAESDAASLSTWSERATSVDTGDALFE